MHKLLEQIRSNKEHPDDIKYFIADWDTTETDEWEYEEIAIGDIENMLESYSIEVDSPDGFVPVSGFIDKGMQEQYVFVSSRGDIVRCSNGHRFETTAGWIYAKDFPIENTLDVLHDDGKYYKSTCVKSDSIIPIVDIAVDHENHRYYTNGVSSHNTGGGKSLVKCHAAAAALMAGKNVVYITMEMPEEMIAQRIDANLLDISLDDLMELPKETYQKMITRVKSKTAGKLIVKDYPTGTASAATFRYMLSELRLKKNFVPDLICIDYLNICSSSRVKNASANSYTIIKSVAEEIRGIAMEYNCAVLTSSQYNRSGYCLDLDTIVNTPNGIKKIVDLQIGDSVSTSTGYNTVTNIYDQKDKEVYLIKTKSGKSIICSGDHKFPILEEKYDISIKSGLTVGNKLFIANDDSSDVEL